MLRSSAIAALPYSIGSGLEIYAAGDEARRKDILPRLKSAIDAGYEKIYMPLEEQVLIDELNLYAKKAGNIAPYIAELASKNNNDFTAYIKEAMKNSIFASTERLNNYLENPNTEILANDPLYKLSTALLNRYRQVDPNWKVQDDKFEAAYRKYVAGVLASNPKGKFYPDANSTLRLSYGSIKGLPKDPRNDADKNFYTTLKGTIAKYKKGDEEFDLPQRLMDLYNNKDYGRYADKKGHLPVNFLNDNDITGGNSGSPVINGNGELIGLAFDGNIEAMAGDVIFDHKLQRTISVDIRYVLFIIDKFAGATNIIEELKIVE